MFIDVQYRQMNKTGEELCGDSIAMHRDGKETVLVLSDGLGSGVKANILSTLTQKIALTMACEHLPLNDVVETIAATLPTCKVRNLAYSTFTIIRIDADGHAEIVDFDNPAVFVFQDGALANPHWEEKKIGNFIIRQASVDLNEGDYLVAVSDGLIHAGIGGREPLGWRWDPIATHIEALVSQDVEAEEVADNLIDAAQNLYRGNTGDDVTVAVMHCRSYRRLTLAIGPPAKKEDDKKMAAEFTKREGVKIICGGTTAKLLSRELNRSMAINMAGNYNRELPPTAEMEGVDLVTEGVITIMHAIDSFDEVRLTRPRARVNVHDISYMYGKRPAPMTVSPMVAEKANLDPAKEIARQLRLADEITILLGCALNPAHQNPELPVHLGLKFHLVDLLTQKLRSRGKEVDIIRYS
jgi:hypothetical protein